MKKKLTIAGAILAVAVLFILFSGQNMYQSEGKMLFVTEDYPPFSFENESGEVTGMATEMVKKIMKKQRIKENIELMPWSEAYDKALNKRNVIIFSIRRTQERENLFNWVGPIAKTSTIFYAKKGSGIALNSMEEAKKISSIGVVDEWFSTQNLRKDGFENLVSSSLPVEVVQKLMNGEVLIAPFVDVTVGGIVEEAGYTIDELEPVFVIDEGYNYIGISNGTSEDIITEWQKDLDELKADGDFEEIYKKYRPNDDLKDLL